MRLIDADALFKRFQKVSMTLYGKDSERYQMVMDIMDGVRFAPTVDAVEVVRCGKCKFYLDAFGGHTCVNDFWNDECVIPTEPNDFCSYGERKEVSE